MIGSALRKWLSHLLLRRPNTKLKKKAENKYFNCDDLCFPKEKPGCWLGATHTAHMVRTQLLRGCDEKFCTSAAFFAAEMD